MGNWVLMYYGLHLEVLILLSVLWGELSIVGFACTQMPCLLQFTQAFLLPDPGSQRCLLSDTQV